LIVQSIHQSSALSRNSSLSNNNISLSFESDDSVEINVDSGSISEQVNNESSDFEENESINHNGSNNCDDGEINFIVIDPGFVSVDDSSNFVSWLREWAVRNCISHVALNELI